MTDLRAFVDEHAVIKPLDRMRGHSIFMMHVDDLYRNVTLEALTNPGPKFVMAQTYISDASVGEKGILLINGEPVPSVLLSDK